MAETSPDVPLQIIFSWSARERDASYSGQGAARIQAPDRARLDLFGPRGERYLSAAVVDDELRVPATVAPELVPPPPLLWSALGVFSPPAGATLVGTEEEQGTVRLEYEETDGGRWRFELVDGRLRNAERVAADGARYTVQLNGQSDFGLPREATYRDWAAFNELTLRLDEVEHVVPFPPEIWDPGAF